MKKIIILSILLIGCLSVNVSAHTLESDNSIGAVIHIDPDDDPVAGEPSHIFFDIHEKNNLFSIDNCHCLLTIEHNGKLISSSYLDFSDEKKENIGYSYFTFPEVGAYKITLSGKPIKEPVFGDFEISYDMRVSKSQNQQSNVGNENGIIFVLGTIVIFSISIFLFLKFRKK